jgi:hypothetical protein
LRCLPLWQILRLNTTLSKCKNTRFLNLKVMDSMQDKLLQTPLSLPPVYRGSDRLRCPLARTGRCLCYSLPLCSLLNVFTKMTWTKPL